MRRAGFTLMELIVVLAIILMLVAILLPVLGAARRTAQASHTRAQMMSLQLATENYRTLFDAYPGPVSEAQVTTSGNFTGAQNLLAALTRKVRTTAAPDYVAVGSTTWIEQDYSTGPERFGRVLTEKLWEPSARETMPGSSANAALCAVPVFVDRFTSPMPILYYHGTAGAITLVGSTPAAGVAAFYLASNGPLTSTTRGSDGNEVVQNLTPAGLQQLVSSADGSARWGYLLLSAGADHIYGPNASGKVDDIVVGGGR